LIILIILISLSTPLFIIISLHYSYFSFSPYHHSFLYRHTYFSLQTNAEIVELPSKLPHPPQNHCNSLGMSGECM
jgi:hypothetical protein